MATFIIRRLLISIPVFLGITILIFTFIALAPGNLADSLVRPELGFDQSAREAIIKRYGLDQPLPVRYVLWLTNALQGELGYRVQSGASVGSEVMRGLINSIILTGSALVAGHPGRHPARGSCPRSVNTRRPTSRSPASPSWGSRCRRSCSDLAASTCSACSSRWSPSPG